MENMERVTTHYMETCADCGARIEPGRTVYKDSDGRYHEPVCLQREEKPPTNARCSCGRTGWMGRYPFIHDQTICDDCLG